MNETDKNLMQTWAVTMWSGVFEGRGQDDAARQARNALLVRYHEAVYKYFLAKIRDPHAAQELYSNFALKLIETDRLIKNADPGRGRFRHYLKAALHHMVMDYYRGRNRRGPIIEPGEFDVAAPDEGDRDGFSSIWRQALLDQAWRVLEAQEQKTGQTHYSVLRAQRDNPDLGAPQLAQRLTAKLGRPFTADGLRQALHRAREKFAALLLEEVERTLESPTADQLEEELIDQQLLTYCKKALEKQRADANKGGNG